MYSKVIQVKYFYLHFNSFTYSAKNAVRKDPTVRVPVVYIWLSVLHIVGGKTYIVGTITPHRYGKMLIVMATVLILRVLFRKKLPF